MSQAFIQCVNVILIILRKHGAKSRMRKVAEGKQSYGTERTGKLQCARMGQWCAAVFIVWIVSAWQLAIRWTDCPESPTHEPSNGTYEVLLITIVSTFICEWLIASQSLDHRPLCAKERQLAAVMEVFFSKPELLQRRGWITESSPIGTRSQARPGFY